jgi:hypothetical protein
MTGGEQRGPNGLFVVDACVVGSDGDSECPHASNEDGGRARMARGGFRWSIVQACLRSAIPFFADTILAKFEEDSHGALVARNEKPRREAGAV